MKGFRRALGLSSDNSNSSNSNSTNPNRSNPVRSPPFQRTQSPVNHPGAQQHEFSHNETSFFKASPPLHSTTYIPNEDDRRKPSFTSSIEGSNYRRPSKNFTPESFGPALYPPQTERRPSDSNKSLQGRSVFQNEVHGIRINNAYRDIEALPVELDDDFIECINDFLIVTDSTDEEKQFFKQFLDVFLSRLHRRLSRKYPVADCFAAAAVGARRLLTYFGYGMNEKVHSIELHVAKSLAGLFVDARTYEDILLRSGIEVAVNCFGNIKNTVERQQIIDQIALEYIRRADTWTPATAAKASQMRKRKIKRDRFLSLFMELEETKAAISMNAIEHERMDFGTRQLAFTDPAYQKQSQAVMEKRFEPFPLRTLESSKPVYGSRKASFGSNNERRPSFGSMEPLRKLSNSETLRTEDQSFPSSPLASQTGSRRGSAEALLQSVLDECENLIGKLHVPSDKKE